jgi:hypothetical protein
MGKRTALWRFASYALDSANFARQTGGERKRAARRKEQAVRVKALTEREKHLYPAFLLLIPLLPTSFLPPSFFADLFFIH